MVSRASAYPRMRSRVVKFLGKYMFEDMPKEEMMNSLKTICPVVTDIHNEKQLGDFMGKIQSTRLPLNYLQWRLYMIPDYSETESVFVFKIHHSLADGIAIVLMFFQLIDAPKLEDFPSIMVRFGWLKDIMIKLFMPIYLVWQLIMFKITCPPQRNGFKTEENIKKLKAHKNI